MVFLGLLLTTQYLNARGDHDIGSIRPRVARCMTGLGSSGRNGNGILGGW